MGSYATGIDADVAAMFAGAFAQLPQKVIWKLNGKPSATVSPNVKVVEWIPQNDLLGKNNFMMYYRSGYVQRASVGQSEKGTQTLSYYYDGTQFRVSIK